jgi:translation initiation factor IF-1
MNHQRRRIISLFASAAILALAIAAAAHPVASAPAAAPMSSALLQEDDDAEEIEITGTVLAIDIETGEIEVETGDGGARYTVIPGEGLELPEISVGDLVEVEGVAGEGTNTIVAYKIKREIEDEDDDIEDDDDLDDDDDDVNFFCANPEFIHPVADRLARAHGVPEAQVMSWFCEEGMGMGQIMLALRTAAVTDDAPEAYLEMRREGMGWGQIWKGRNLIGRGRIRDRDGDDDADRQGPPDWAGKPEKRGRGRGREFAPGQMKKRGGD